MTDHRPLRRAAAAALAAALLGLISADAARAQQQPAPELPAPRLLWVSPLGARAGDTFELSLTGTHLEGAHGLLFSDPRITAELVAAPTPTPVDVAMKGRNR